ncbi:MAG: TPM domain-containing protein [Rickettsiales bacterium]|nr:TPM domain-containing protein [Rickettsiales bacterium]
MVRPKRLLSCISLFCLLFIFANFSWSFPALTGRVVDQANILSSVTKDKLIQTLANLEKTTTDQVVIVTVVTLDGSAIEDYGYKLGRHWGIGQKGKDNGVLIILALKERVVRIEVGYGLESVLTDAVTSDIIRNVMVPELKEGKYDQAFLNGTNQIIKILSSEKQENIDGTSSGQIVNIILLLLFLSFFFSRSVRRAVFFGGGGSSGSGSGGGGFSGGGGGFGGGGSSGKF